MRTAIVWFRRDLRLADHAALARALATAERVVPVYIHEPGDEAPWAPGAASRWWLHHSLAALDTALRTRGSRLVILRGPALEALLAVAAATGAGAVHWNRRYEPALIARDTAVKAALRESGLLVDSEAGNVLVEPWQLCNRSGEPFRVFTPFWRACGARLDAISAHLAAAPRALAPPTGAPAGIGLDELALLPRIRWDTGLHASWTPGEDAAQSRLAEFLGAPVAGYADDRDRPDRPGTSRLSPHLHFGEISARQALVAARAAAAAHGAAHARGTDSFLRELGWREFAQHLLYAFPHTQAAPMDPRFASFPWRADAAALAAWQHGRTGIPLVDAGMRELWHTGWMHNRVRMVVASLLTKNLGQHWLDGARWFHDTLVDADLASNTLGWQWAAGCGADAAPFYRIFNPVLQGERFDPERAYLRRWLPELGRLPDAWLARPFEAPSAVLAAAGVELGRDYPRPIVELGSSRERALAAWAALRGGDRPPQTVRARPVRRVPRGD